MTDIISQDDANAAIKDLSKKWLMFVAAASVVGAVMFFGWDYIAQSVRNYDLVRAVPALQDQVKTLRNDLAGAQSDIVRLRREVDELHAFFPRRPAIEKIAPGWETTVRPARQ